MSKPKASRSRTMASRCSASGPRPEAATRLRMKTPSSGWLGMRKRSPSSAPPDSGLCGSHASTATVCPCLRKCSISLPTSVLLPTPPAPVSATTRAGLLAGPSCARVSSPARPHAAKVNTRLSARRSCCRKRSSSSSGMGLLASLTQEVNDFREGRSRTKDAGHAHLEQLGDVALGNDAADQDADVLEFRLAQELEQARHER